MATRNVERFISIIKGLYNKYQEIVNYIIFGVLTTVVSLIVKYGLLFTVLDATNTIQLEVAVVLSWVAACSFAYGTNRRFVFKSKSSNIAKEMAMFFGARLVTLGLEAVLMGFFINLLGFNSNTQVFIWTMVIQAIVIVANYVLSKLFVFANKTGSHKAVTEC